MRRAEKEGPSVDEEGICLRCGRCCRGKVEVDGTVYFTDEVCPFLDAATGLCRVYEHRFDVCSDCISARDALEIGALPEDCPYTKGVPGYRGPRPFEELLEKYGRGIPDETREGSL